MQKVAHSPDPFRGPTSAKDSPFEIISWSLIVGPVILDLLYPYEDAATYVIYSNCITAGLALLAFHFCSYDRTMTKAALFLAAIWRVSVIWVNLLADPTEYSLPIIYALSILLGAYLIRYRFAKEVPACTPPEGTVNAYYGLVKIHSVTGLLQAIVMPWHMARYESRVIMQGKYLWCVHRSVFKKKIFLLNDKNRARISFVPLNRPLTQEEVRTLNNMVGQVAITGIRDCRKLFIAGSVKQVLKGVAHGK